jgi:hypothetical protein
MSAPLAAQAVYKAVIFSVNTTAQGVLLGRKRPLHGGEQALFSLIFFTVILIIGGHFGHSYDRLSVSAIQTHASSSVTCESYCPYVPWLLCRAASGTQPTLDYAEVFGCGTLAGSVNSMVVTPVELVRNRLVTLRGRYHGPSDCLREILRTDGPAGLFRVGARIATMGIRHILYQAEICGTYIGAFVVRT